MIRFPAEDAADVVQLGVREPERLVDRDGDGFGVRGSHSATVAVTPSVQLRSDTGYRLPLFT